MSDEIVDPFAEHKEAATQFLRLVSSGNVREGYRLYAGPTFRHHNPFFRSDAESLMLAMEESEETIPGKILEVQRTVAEGDLVVVHSRVRREAGDIDMALVHIFRFEDGRIAELWDIGQVVPEEMPNELGMF